MHRFKCSKCGTLNVGNQEFCLVCKTPRTDSRDTTPEVNKQPIQTYSDEEMNAMVCNNCGSSLHANAKFCTKCGASVMPQDQTSFQSVNKRCPQCQAELPSNVHFCRKCGHAVDQPSHDRSRSMASDRCSACGAIRAPNTKFCTKCGQKL